MREAPPEGRRARRVSGTPLLPHESEIDVQGNQGDRGHGGNAPMNHVDLKSQEQGAAERQIQAGDRHDVRRDPQYLCDDRMQGVQAP